MTTPAEIAFFDQFRTQTTEAIRRRGCQVVHVSDDGRCACCAAAPVNRAERRAAARERRGAGLTRPPFTYTIGLHGVGHPELLVFGLDQQTATLLLVHLTHEVCHHGGDLLPGELIDATPVIRAPLLVETLPNPGQVLLRANDYYRRSGHGSVEGLQLTWCDEQGRWPGDPACAAPAADQPRPGTFRA